MLRYLVAAEWLLGGWQGPQQGVLDAQALVELRASSLRKVYHWGEEWAFGVLEACLDDTCR